MPEATLVLVLVAQACGELPLSKPVFFSFSVAAEILPSRSGSSPGRLRFELGAELGGLASDPTSTNVAAGDVSGQGVVVAGAGAAVGGTEAAH